MYTIVRITLFKYIFQKSRLAMSAISERAIKFLFCRGNESHKYVDLNISKDELYSNGISDKVNIKKTGC